MNPVLRVLAVLMVLAAIVLAAFAYVLLRQPTPPAVRAEAPAAQTAQRTEPEAKTYPVVVASRDLKEGDVLSATALKTVRWPQVPARSFTGDTALRGKVLRFDVREGQPLTSFLLAQGLAAYLDDNQRAVEIPVAPATEWRAVRPGDLVDIYFTLGQGAEVGSTQSRLVMARVRVLAYGGRTMDLPELSKDADKDAKVPTHAVVAVDQGQVNLLLLLASKGVLRFALRPVRDTSEPDPALFPKRKTVLEGRAGLGPAERLHLADPANVAYAGESLEQVAATRTATQHEAAPGPQGSANSNRKLDRSVQIIRGGQSTRQSY